MKSGNSTVEHITRNHLCVQCGTCVSACPTKAITINEFRKTGLIYPLIDENICINCGLCNDVCPVNKFSLYTEPIDNHKKIGIIAINSKDKEKVSSSGGAVSEILKYLFRKGLINKAVVAVKQEGKILEPLGKIIKSENEVDQARGSIYQPIALNEMLCQVSKEDKIAVVGLPCHIQGLVQYIQETKKIPGANVYKVGIFCNIGRSRNATRFLVDKYSDKAMGDIKAIHYRKGEYPGYLSLEYDSNRVEVKYKEYMTRIGYFFTPRGCLFCDDLFNEKADISVGDPWGLVSEKKALVISRTATGTRILDDLLEDRIFELDKVISKEEAIKTQNYKHKKNRVIRSRIYKKLGISIPPKIESEFSNFQDEKLTAFNILLSIILIFNSALFNSRIYRVINLFPIGFLSRIASIIKKKYRTNY